MEIIIVIAVLLIVIGISTASFLGIKENQLLKNSTEEVLNTLNKARSLTLTSLDSSEYGVHFSSDQIVLFKGTSYVINDIDNEIISIVNPVSISNIALGGGSDIYFNRLNGSPNVSGTITISSSGKTQVISISALGIVSVN